MITTVLLDLDGVVRHFDPAHGVGIEERHALAPGALLAAAFAPDVLTRVITGEITHDEWIAHVGRSIGNPDAATAWTADRGAVDWDMIAIVDTLRTDGITVAVLTNGTSLIPSDLIELDLVSCFDAVFNSAEIGFAKPDPRAFVYVCEHLGVGPHQVFFTDDSASKLSGAITIGMTARQFESVDCFRQDLLDLGIAP